MRGDLSFGEDEEGKVGREVELGTVEPENRQSGDRENVIEMVQEDGLPVEEKPKKVLARQSEKLEDEARAESEAEETARTPGKSEEPAKGGRVFRKVVVVAVVALLMVGSMIAGAFWQREENAGNSTEAEVTEEALLGGGGGVPLKDVKPIPEGDKLALAFLKLHNVRENSCYSPLSMRYALEMLREGAEGETKAQIDALLGNVAVTPYENVAEHLSLANSLWVRPSWEGKVRDDYKKILKEKFGAEVKTDDFQSAENMNGWIENNTLGLLKNVLLDEDVKELDTALVNVLAIDMYWAQQFEKDSTFGGYFDFDWDKGEDNEKYTMMHIIAGGSEGERSLYYNLAEEATVFAMDLREYNGTELQFVAIMPEDLTSYVETVSNEDINQLLAGLRMARGQNGTYNFFFDGYIPKFGVEKGGVENLISDLRELGVVDAFDSERANFAKMVGEGQQFAIENATQKTKFDFSEEGIRAAAVTAIGGRGAAGGPAPIPSSSHIVVSINKPFMYLVRDTKTGEIWFAGTIYKPNLWADEEMNYKWAGE